MDQYKEDIHVKQDDGGESNMMPCRSFKKKSPFLQIP
jgi:hypothetical protein